MLLGSDFWSMGYSVLGASLLPGGFQELSKIHMTSFLAAKAPTVLPEMTKLSGLSRSYFRARDVQVAGRVSHSTPCPCFLVYDKIWSTSSQGNKPKTGTSCKQERFRASSLIDSLSKDV